MLASYQTVTTMLFQILLYNIEFDIILQSTNATTSYKMVPSVDLRQPVDTFYKSIRRTQATNHPDEHFILDLI